MDAQTLEHILAAITPERMRDLIALTVAQGNEVQSVGLAPIIRMLTAECDLGVGEGRWLALQQLRQAIQRAVAQIPGMRYVEGES
jgi:hypothetical protein